VNIYIAHCHCATSGAMYVLVTSRRKEEVLSCFWKEDRDKTMS